jgi:hypothetical protein
LVGAGSQNQTVDKLWKGLGFQVFIHVSQIAKNKLHNNTLKVGS